ncbi:signal transducing adapter molecule 2 [Onthophagus taurus]|uniref:signal transducing adapter molecule 2 n=1 Tax=Onthophagus taurus TaxID=166361 RepID=UPI0039BE71E1
MPIFGSSPSQFDADVERATSESSPEEDWSVIIDVCDKAGKSTDDAKNYLKAIMKRLSNVDPHIAIKAVTLLDACVKNSGKTFHLEVASRDFQSEYHKLLASQKTHPKVVEKLKESLKRWAEEESFKKDPELRLIPTLYSDLKHKGIDFNVETPMKKTVVLSKDPNVVQSQDEEDQIAKAIELSLKEANSSPRSSSGGATTTGLTSTSLYPSTNLSTVTNQPAQQQKEPRKVRALYDFEAAEDNELTFTSGEIILVLDDSDQNWWKGSNHRGEGLFPANFVTYDLQAELENDKKKAVHFEESNSNSDEAAAGILKELENVQIDEDKVNRLLHLLHEVDPTDLETETDEMLKIEREVNAMGPLIDSELERVDRKHAQLTQLSSDLVEAFSLYHTLMREQQFPTLPNKCATNYGNRYQPSLTQPPTSMFNGNMPPSNIGHPSMMYSLPLQDRPQVMMPQSMHQFPPMQLPSGPSSMGGPISMSGGPQSMQPQGIQPVQSMMMAPPQNIPSNQGQNLPPPGSIPEMQIRSSFHPSIMQNFPGGIHHHQAYQQSRTASMAQSHVGAQVGPPAGQQPQNGPYSTSNTHIM